MTNRNKLLLGAVLIIIVLCTFGAFSIDYGSIKFSDFKSKAFSPKAGSGAYYDSFTIYYKSYNSNGYECISEYYLTSVSCLFLFSKQAYIMTSVFPDFLPVR